MPFEIKNIDERITSQNEEECRDYFAEYPTGYTLVLSCY